MGCVHCERRRRWLRDAALVFVPLAAVLGVLLAFLYGSACDAAKKRADAAQYSLIRAIVEEEVARAIEER